MHINNTTITSVNSNYFYLRVNWLNSADYSTGCIVFVIKISHHTLFFSQNASIEKKHYVTLSAKQKQEICQRKAKESQLSNSELAKEYRVGKTTVQSIIINKPYAKRLRKKSKAKTANAGLIGYSLIRPLNASGRIIGCWLYYLPRWFTKKIPMCWRRYQSI